MRIVGLITEYNPFHNGHKYHLEQSKKETNCDYSIALMSGNFVQRGEPAIVDKWHRAKMAIDSGVDLVLELPTIYSTMSAEFFSYGAVRLLDSLKVINTISFGSESNNMVYYDRIANTLLRETESFKSILKKNLDKGLSYPKSRTNALIEVLGDRKIEKILNSPNNILAIEYVKALKRLNSSIKPHSIQRISADYNELKLTGDISSATAVRRVLLKDENILNNPFNSLPLDSIKHLKEYKRKYSKFNSLINFNDIILYKLRTMKPENYKKFIDIEGGLENRIIDAASKFNDITSIIASVKTKRYTYTRLQRILIHILLDITFTKKDILNFPLYARILGSNSKGFEIINNIKNNSEIPIINKVSDYMRNYNNFMFDLDIKASNIYFLGIDNNTNIKNNFDYYLSPYIKTS